MIHFAKINNKEFTMANSFAHNEMLVHVPVCTHKAPENILIFSDDAGIKTETTRHKTMNFTTMATKGYEDTISNATDNSFDIVIVDGVLSNDKVFLAHLNRVTTNEGVVVFTNNDYLTTIDATRAQFNALGEYFKIVMPYTFDEENSTARGTHFIATKFYHPTADMVLHRTDLIDGLSYYNCDVHPASFAQANYVRTALKGVARN